MEKNLEELKLKAKAMLLHEKAEREKRFKEHWNNLPKFTKPKDVPDLPRVETKEWKEFYVPKLIEAGAIPKKDLLDGKYYFGEHRNATVALWDEERNCFFYNRTKFNHTFEDKCNHFEDDDGYALFVPIGEATEEEYKENKLLR
jgi:hypothetical protein